MGDLMINGECYNCLTKSDLAAPQTGQTQFSGKSSNRVADGGIINVATRGTDVFAGRQGRGAGLFRSGRSKIGGGVLGRFALLDIPIVGVGEGWVPTVSHIAIKHFTDDKQVRADINDRQFCSVSP